MECGLSPFGKPIEFFLIDPPIDKVPVDGKMRSIMEVLDLTPRGVQVRERNGVFHVFDYVGEEHYPDVQTFVEEVRALGASRRCELAAVDYAKLTCESRMILIHPRAMILNHKRYDVGDTPTPDCPKLVPGHERKSSDEMCVRLWRYDLTPFAGDRQEPPADFGKMEPDEAPPEAVAKLAPWVEVNRTLPCGRQFGGFYRHESIEPKYAPAFFLSLPITNLALVDSKGTFDNKRQRLEGASLPWEVVKE